MIDTTGKTLQEVSDEIAGKLIEQGSRCVRSENSEFPNADVRCAYSDGEGNHCAIGWLLDPKNEAVMSFGGGLDSMSLAELISEEPNKEFISENREALIVIQRIHDHPRKEGRRDNLGVLAIEHGLDTSAWLPWVELGEERPFA